VASVMPSTTSNNLITSTKWDGSNETQYVYKTWMKDVSLWANKNDMAWIMKITERPSLQESTNFKCPVSRPLGKQFLDEAQSARDELLAEIQGSAETDVGVEPAENQQADDVIFGHKMMYLVEPNCNVTTEEFADEDLAALLRADEKSKGDLVASMHMLKLSLS